MKDTILPDIQQNQINAMIRILNLSDSQAVMFQVNAELIYLAGKAEGIQLSRKVINK